MSISKIAVDLLIGFGITFTTSAIFGQILPKITKRTNTYFDDFVIKTRNAPDQVRLQPGQQIEIGWLPEDCRALDA